MPSVRKSLLQFVFSGSFMRRWNDKQRVKELTEVDKQAHKMMVAWALYELACRDLPTHSHAERVALGVRVVEGGIFDYLYRLVITDIKPPVFYRIKENARQYRELTHWVLNELQPRLQPLGEDFWNRLSTWLLDPNPDDPAARILGAAHIYASGYEFGLIKPINPADEEMEDIGRQLRQGLADFADLPGVSELLDGRKAALGRFAHLCGQLRFQIRWSQTPRVPETSVLGHMFIVAAYAWFFGLALDACPAMRLNMFFSGLFHDLPELLTRDIISPVKKSSEEIAGLIKEYEDQELQTRVFAPLAAGGHQRIADRLAFLLGLDVGSEFACTALVDGVNSRLTRPALYEGYNADGFDPKDGETLKVMDNLAAFIEAYTAIRNGISADHLQQALYRLRTQHKETDILGKVHIGALLADFD